MKKGDILPVVDAELCDRRGPVDLTGATVNFIIKSPTGVVKINAACVIVDAANALVRYHWVPTDTNTPGAYRGEFQVSYPGGTLDTFPNDKYIPVIITEDLA